MAVEGMFKAALEYVEDGIAVFPLKPGSKVPITAHGVKDAKLDAMPWAPNGPTRDCNLAIATGAPSGGLCVLDIDGERGEASLVRLLADRGLQEPVTYTVRTGGGGRHLYFRAPPTTEGAVGCGIGCRAYGKEYPGIDVRGDGGYVVAPPSVHRSGESYRLELAVAPIEWPSALLPPQNAPVAQTTLEGGDEDTTAHRAEQAMLRGHIKASTMPPAIEGENGSGACFIVAVELARLGLTKAEALEVMEKSYNPRCLPPWSSSELQHKIESAYTSSPLATDSVALTDSLAQKVARVRAFLPDSGPPSDEGDGDGGPDNKDGTYCYSITEEKYVIRSKGRWRLDAPMGKEGLLHWLVSIGHGYEDARNTIKNMAYPIAMGVVCLPGENPLVKPADSNLYAINTYVAPALRPAKGECPSIDRLLLSLTGGDPGGVTWLKNWCAALVQNPDHRTQTAPVLCCPKTGTGKTTFGNVMRTIVGLENSVEIGQAQLNSNFNATYAGSLLVLANEAFSSEHSGDQQNRLKALVTDETIIVNAKGVREYAIQNRTSWILTSNKGAVVPEGATDRRWSIFESESPTPKSREFLRGLYQDDGKFTAAFIAEIAAFAWELYNTQVDRVALVTPYENQAREKLIESVKTPEEDFLDQCILRGAAVMVAENPPESWAKEGRPPEREWNFGERGVAQTAVAGALVTYANRHWGKRRVTTNRFTQLAKDRGIEVGRVGTGKRPYVYIGFPVIADAPETENAEAQTDAGGKLLDLKPSIMASLRNLTSGALPVKE